MNHKKNQPHLQIQSIHVEEILNTIEGGNINDVLKDKTESLMQAASPQPTKRISNPDLTGTAT